VIYYAFRTLDLAQCNYTTTKKEMYAIVFVLEKFRPYLLGVKVTIYTNHSTITHLLSKNDSKSRLIRGSYYYKKFNWRLKINQELKI